MAQEAEKVAEFISLRAPEQKLRLVCEQVKRCFKNGQTVAVHVADRQEAQRLDEMLWTFEDRSFIPHVISAEAEEPLIEPVSVFSGNERPGECEALIEAAGGEPNERATQFHHVLDFAELYDAERLRLSRARYRACQDAGYRMRFID